MEDKKDINCEELTKKMNECLQNGDDDKCKDLLRNLTILCKRGKWRIIVMVIGYVEERR